MANNKFATMVHNRTNKLTLILVYVVLEWILIILLLLNSLFSYLIIEFADYFGLKRPCLWCSRVDHVLDPQNTNHSYEDLVCESHAREISKLGYCSNHRKLVESQDMCEDCSSSWKQNSHGVPKKITFLIREGDDKKMGEKGEVNLKCSCCDESLEIESKYFYSSYLLINPNWGVLDYTQKANLITETGVDDEIKEGLISEQSRSDFTIDHSVESQGIKENFIGNEFLLDVVDKVGVFIEKEEEGEPFKEEGASSVSMEDSSCDDITIQFSPKGEDAALELLPQHLEFYIDNDNSRLIPITLVDFATSEKGNNETKLLVEGLVNCDGKEALLASELQEGNGIELVMEDKCSSGESEEKNPQIAVIEAMELGENLNPLVLLAEEGDLIIELLDEDASPEAASNISKDDDDDETTEGAAADGGVNLDDHLDAASEEVSQMRTNDTKAGVSTRTEIPDQEDIPEAQTQEDIIAACSRPQEDPSIGSFNLCADDDHGSKQVEEEMAECKTISIEMSDQTLKDPMSSDHHEIEEEKAPETPNSVDHLDKKMLLLEKTYWGGEESLDGCLISEFEASKGVLTVESLKSALRTEREALNALYVELEEERSASAIAADETLAMINRLQEEKASMQMEALQYQRMMEEQSEYDQEALQLLNELMVKRERENQELEKELEIYRKKVADYEAKERMMMMLKRVRDCSTRSRNSTTSCSNGEDSDGLSIDLNQEGKEEESFCSRHCESDDKNTPIEAVLNMDESLAYFEDERLLILEQLRVLEEKLFSLADEEERHLEDMKPFEQFYKENGNEFEEHFGDGSVANGLLPKKINVKSRIMDSKAQRLLPLFDAVSAETEDGVMNGNEHGLDFSVPQPFQVTKFELETKKLAFEEEVDHLYDRLHALEADREFLKHCVRSLKKGDKGTDILEEILQHLRDLRNIELRVNNVSVDGPQV